MYVPRDGDYPPEGEDGGKGVGAKGVDGLEGGSGQQARPDKATFEGVGGTGRGAEEDSQG